MLMDWFRHGADHDVHLFVFMSLAPLEIISLQKDDECYINGISTATHMC